MEHSLGIVGFLQTFICPSKKVVPCSEWKEITCFPYTNVSSYTILYEPDLSVDVTLVSESPSKKNSKGPQQSIIMRKSTI